MARKKPVKKQLVSLQVTESFHPAVGYCRVSGPKQLSNSFNRQRAEIIRFAFKHQFTLVDCFYEIRAGWKYLKVREKTIQFADSIGALIITEAWNRFSRYQFENPLTFPCVVGVFEYESGMYLPA